MFNYMSYNIFIIILSTIICTILFIISFFFILFGLYLFVFALLQISTLYTGYNKNTQRIIKKYGNYKIKKMYFCKENLTSFSRLTSNIATLYKYNKFLKSCFHTSIILILAKSRNKVKLVRIDKLPSSIYLEEDLRIQSYKKIKNVSIIKDKFTLKDLLDKTKKNMGSVKFFNWQIKSNNCQHFSKNLIESIQRKKKKIFTIQSVKFTKSEINILNIVNIFSNLLYKNILNYYFNFYEISFLNY